MADNNPQTTGAHRQAYREHRVRVDELKVQIDLGLLNGLDPDKHREMVEEYHDELLCAVRHYVASQEGK